MKAPFTMSDLHSTVEHSFHSRSGSTRTLSRSTLLDPSYQAGLDFTLPFIPSRDAAAGNQNTV